MKNSIDWKITSADFGQVIPFFDAVTFTEALTYPWAKLVVYAPDLSSIYCVQFFTLYEGKLQSFDDIVFGPTPSWSGGPGLAKMILLDYTSRGTFRKKAESDYLEVLG
jgi:hypothetical protein